MADERKDAGKERTKGVRVHRGVLTRAGEFLPFFFLALFFVVVDFAFLLSSSSKKKKKKSTTTWHFTRGKSKTLWEEETFFSQSREFDSLKSESSSFFFSIFFFESTAGFLQELGDAVCRNSVASLLKTKNKARNTRFSRQANKFVW